MLQVVKITDEKLGINDDNLKLRRVINPRLKKEHNDQTMIKNRAEVSHYLHNIYTVQPRRRCCGDSNTTRHQKCQVSMESGICEITKGNGLPHAGRALVTLFNLSSLFSRLIYKQSFGFSLNHCASCLPSPSKSCCCSEDAAPVLVPSIGIR